MIEFSIEEDIIDKMDEEKKVVPPTACFLCGQTIDHANYNKSCAHLKFVYSSEGGVWHSKLDNIMQGYDEEGDEDEFDYLKLQLNDNYIMFSFIGGFMGTPDIYFVFSPIDSK